MYRCIGWYAELLMVTILHSDITQRNLLFSLIKRTSIYLDFNYKPNDYQY